MEAFGTNSFHRFSVDITKGYRLIAGANMIAGSYTCKYIYEIFFGDLRKNRWDKDAKFTLSYRDMHDRLS